MFSHNWPGKGDASRRLLKVSTQEATPDRDGTVRHQLIGYTRTPL